MPSSSERPLSYLQYAGGNSRPHEVQDKSGDWGIFFEAQCLVKKTETEGHLMVAMKTSEISETGVMVVQAGAEGAPPIRNIGDLDLARAQSHLDLVASVMTSLDDLKPDDQLKLWQINNTAHLPYETPSDIGNPLTDVPLYTSQTIATLHSHCDSISGNALIPIGSLLELKRQHALHLEKDVDDKMVTDFLREKRRNIKPRVFYRLAKQIWETDLSPRLLSRYPHLFERSSSSRPLSLVLHGGWDTLRTPEFAEAILLTHHVVSSKWREIANAINNPELIADEDTILRKLANTIQLDRGQVPDRRDWLHEDFNYTLGVAQWNGESPVFFVDPTVDVGSGIQAINIHSIREHRELTSKEIEQRGLFRLQLTEALLTNNPSLKLGKEGEYLKNLMPQ